MKRDRLEVVRGSGNVFRDVGHKDADAARLKAVLAAEIIKALDVNGSPAGPPTPAPASRRRTSPASGTLTSGGSPKSVINTRYHTLKQNRKEMIFKEMGVRPLRASA
jgi:hypothetical protein